MSAQRALVTISENIRQLAIGLSSRLPCARSQERDGVFRFEGFSGSVVVDLVGAGLTVLEPRSDSVVFSSLLDEPADDEKAIRVAGRVCDEMLTVYRQRVVI